MRGEGFVDGEAMDKDIVEAHYVLDCLTSLSDYGKT